MPDEMNEWKWLGDQVWLDLLEPMLTDDAALADRAAKLWHYLLVQIESGPEGVTTAAVCLENALRLTFPPDLKVNICDNAAADLPRHAAFFTHPENQVAASSVTEGGDIREELFLI